MPINTKKVTGRRQVHYNSHDEFLDEARRLSQTDVRSLGNWSQGQIYEHLALSLDSAIDGAGFAFPAPVRWLMSLLMKKKFLTKPIPAGFNTTERFIPKETSVETGLAVLEKAVQRQKDESNRAIHPGFGKITREEWDAFNLRHAETHMSFLVEK